MKIIAIDTSGKFCSVAISLSNNIKDSIISKIPLSHSSELAVNLQQLINRYNIVIKDLDFIVINIGPGSFTGLRIGVSFAKGLCLSNNIPLVPVSAFNIINSKVDCLENLFYYGIYSHKNYAYSKKYNNNIASNPKLIDLRKKINAPLYLYGLNDFNQYDNNIIKVNFNALDLINFDFEEFQNKRIDDLNSINPIYIDYRDEV